MQIRFTRIELSCGNRTRWFMAPGHITSLSEVQKNPTAVKFIGEHILQDEVDVCLTHFCYGEGEPAYDADENHIRLMRAHDELAELVHAPSFSGGSMTHFVGNTYFTVPYEPKEAHNV